MDIEKIKQKFQHNLETDDIYDAEMWYVEIIPQLIEEVERLQLLVDSFNATMRDVFF